MGRRDRLRRTSCPGRRGPLRVGGARDAPARRDAGGGARRRAGLPPRAVGRRHARPVGASSARPRAEPPRLDRPALGSDRRRPRCRRLPRDGRRRGGAPGVGARAGRPAHPLGRRDERGRPREPAGFRGAGRHGGPFAPLAPSLVRRDEPARDVRRGREGARPRGGAPGARVHAGALPAVVRALDARGVDRDPLERPAVARLRTDRAPLRRRARRDAGGTARPAAVPRVGGRSGPARAGARERGASGRDHRGDGPCLADSGGRGGPRRLPSRLPVRDRRGPRPGRDAPPALDAPPLDARRDPDDAPSRRARAARPGPRDVPLAPGRAGGEVSPPRRDLRRREPREADAAAGPRGARDAWRRGGREGVRPGVAQEPVPGPLPQKRPVGGGLGRRHPRDGGSLEPSSRAPDLGRDGPSHRADRRGRAGPRLHAPVARLPRRFEPLHDVPLPPRRRPGREPRPLAEAQDGGIRGHRRGGRDDQSPARRRNGSRPVARGREGRARHPGAPRASSAPSTPTVS